MEGNPNQERIRRRIEREQDEAARTRERELAARALDTERIFLEIPLACKKIVDELNRLDWPDAILQNATIIYPVNRHSGVDMEGEIYMQAYLGDCEYDPEWKHFTDLDSLAPPSHFLGILQRKLAELQSQ